MLDEATSNLDNEYEAIVQDSINTISKNITTFIISRRLSTIKRADIIYVMSKGPDKTGYPASIITYK
ncbi:hypothetical protein [Methanospirillum sp.]|uniref:hypothetical protein n=1 Tax=Methanospirillum sp. TaxID=45200 RepID=UPI00359F54B4